jgi:hypothetical protein
MTRLPRKLSAETTGSLSAFSAKNLVMRSTTNNPPQAQRIAILPQCHRLMRVLTGYEDWNFQGDVLLSPAEIKRVEIKLIPKTP